MYSSWDDPQIQCRDSERKSKRQDYPWWKEDGSKKQKANTSLEFIQVTTIVLL